MKNLLFIWAIISLPFLVLGQKLELSKTEYSPGDYIKIQGIGFAKNLSFTYQNVSVIRNDGVRTTTGYLLTSNGNKTDENGNFTSTFLFGDEFGTSTEKSRKITIRFDINNVKKEISFILLNRPFIEWEDGANINNRFNGYLTTSVGPLDFYFYTNYLSGYDEEEFVIKINNNNILNSSKEEKFKSIGRYNTIRFEGDIKTKFKEGLNTLSLTHIKSGEKFESSFMVGTPYETGIFISKKQYLSGEEIDAKLLNFNPNGRIQISIEGPDFKDGTAPLLIQRGLGEIVDQWGRFYIPNDYISLRKGNTLKVGKYKISIKELLYNTTYESDFEIVNAVLPLSPNFTFTPAAPKVNQAINFKDESTGSPTSWLWDFGDGTTSTQQNPTKTYTRADNFNVKLTITKQGATAASMTKSITVTAEATTLTLSATTRAVSVSGEQGSFSLTTNTNWTARSNANWLKISPVSGNAGSNLPINYTAEANTNTAARTGIITFTAGTQTATFTVTQAGIAPSLSVSSTTPATIGASGATLALSVISNLSWSVTKSANSDWITISPISGTGNQNVSVTASANAATTERSATLTFSATGVANVVVTIRQAGANASLSLSATTRALPVSGEQGSFNLTTNTNWTASSNANWLKISPVSGNAGSSLPINYTAEANTNTAARTGIITFTAGTQTATFTVTQAGKSRFGITIISPTAGTTLKAGKSVELLTELQEGSLGTYYTIALYAIGSNVPISPQTSSNFIQGRHYYTVPETIVSGEYELRITSKSNPEVSGSVQVNVAGKAIKKFTSGITVVTHGFQPMGTGKVEDFVMGDDSQIGICAAIKKRVEDEGGKATIYRNDIDKSTWVKVSGEGNEKDEVILFYNWSILSNDPNDGALEASADNLFAMLARPKTSDGKIPDKLFESDLPFHFIAHGRGNILLLQVLHRLRKYFPNKKIEHFTLLDPHPAALFMNDINKDSENNSLPGVYGLPKNFPAEPYLRLPGNVIKADVYYRQDNKYEPIVPLFESTANFSGIRASNAFNTLLDEENIRVGTTPLLGILGIFKIPHSGVHEWYRGTIVPDDSHFESEGRKNWYKGTRQKVGYNKSRVAEGLAILPNVSDTISLAEMEKRIQARTGQPLNAVFNYFFKYGTPDNLANATSPTPVGNSFLYGFYLNDGYSTINTNSQESSCTKSNLLGGRSTCNHSLTHSNLYFPKESKYLKVTVGGFSRNAQLGVRYFSFEQSFQYAVPLQEGEKVYYIEVPTWLLGDIGRFELLRLRQTPLGELFDTIEILGVELVSSKPPSNRREARSYFSIHPNPTQGTFTIGTENLIGKPKSIRIFDEIGSLIYQQALNESCCEPFRVNFPRTGIYQVVVETDSSVASQRLIYNP
ncbi:BACON domain-containing protein [Runella salmonicolor]|uniref:PKD domain-containing protein n=1 Tax=Runella salmonicolor TaxID=2950278 RepID=A0ABT1FLR6_9BACT|nr:BACON domain-containing carbohydrate-binding protein [Runella salmonicolor]MCP1382705.1 PKD domain-containing protein [Runella salmonicolor]